MSDDESSKEPQAPPSLSDTLAQQVRVSSFFPFRNVQELNKKVLLIESEKEKARSDAEAMKQLFCQEMRIEYDEKVWIRRSRLRVAECWRSASPFPRLSAARGRATAGKAGGA